MTKITFPLGGENAAQCMAERDAEIGRLQAALFELKCHLYAQDAMTDGEIIAACRVIADRALAKEEGK